MKNNEIPLPSNQKFGYFFTFVFLAVGSYFYVMESLTISYIFIPLAVITLVLTLFIPEALLIFNRMWFRLGMLLNFIVSPIVLGVIFFLMITPISIVTSVFGRDELKIKKKASNSFWVYSNTKSIAEKSFKDQF